MVSLDCVIDLTQHFSACHIDLFLKWVECTVDTKVYHQTHSSPQGSGVTYGQVNSFDEANYRCFVGWFHAKENWEALQSSDCAVLGRAGWCFLLHMDSSEISITLREGFYCYCCWHLHVDIMSAGTIAALWCVWKFNGMKLPLRTSNQPIISEMAGEFLKGLSLDIFHEASRSDRR